MKNNPGGRKKKVGSERVAKELGYLYLHRQGRLRGKGQDEERLNLTIFLLIRSFNPFSH